MNKYSKFEYNSIFRAETERKIANESRRKQISTNNALSILHIIYIHTITQNHSHYFSSFLAFSFPYQQNRIDSPINCINLTAL